MPLHGNWLFFRASFVLLLSSWRACYCGKILVVPFEGSHWVNMEVLIKALHSHGHSVDVIRTDKSWYIKDGMPHYSPITVSVTEAFDPAFVDSLLKTTFALEREGSSVMNFVRLQLQMFEAMFGTGKIMCTLTSAILQDDNLMARLKERRYDLLLTDPALGTGVILAHALQLPLVYNVRWVMCKEGHLVLAPSPLSYVPMTGSRLSDKMTFLQRIKNLVYFVSGEALYTFTIIPQYQAVCNQFFGPEVRYDELLQKADVWLMRADFVFEFPRPTMPNVIYIGGFQCKPAEPLPNHLEEFVQSSGQHGVIIMSLGTLIGELPSYFADEIAAAFAKLPQKVIWSYRGTKPSTLDTNTLIVDWMPQNDLLGHHKVKLFVAHGGTNGVQEAIYHGIPVVGIPFFFDQHDNLLRLTERGAAVVVTLASMDKDDSFLKALQEVLTNPSYSNSMQRLSRLHRDQPIPPLDSALFWIEFVMRHKGAAHLRTESYKLPWYAYYNVDIVVTFFTTAAVMFLLPVVFLRTHVFKTNRK
ncbi:UDP-glucuronosyltransferase 2C1-like [Hippocampus zosterae]|uniref:UDP-glucuronosyltransferase 2C1-like n=1 Tax=Hippocampus zosterae TaxID=109293 RepID=UPI00223CEE06|nr:UDP-glucuronosyltransferase 2C1-like [Hippocampus zosterae]XP_051918848.1 UDP-glucuronosyltransferase 2C1-like [Hippocampus zosterae]XP_051918849.1 UDP-glucuronosyltransferase 2C1-like [Hippocampus zosterae]